MTTPLSLDPIEKELVALATRLPEMDVEARI